MDQSDTLTENLLKEGTEELKVPELDELNYTDDNEQLTFSHASKYNSLETQNGNTAINNFNDSEEIKVNDK